MRVIHAQAQPATTGRTLTDRLKLLQPTAVDLIDGGFLVALGLLALAGFVTGFDSWLFLAVAATGLLLGVLVAHAANVLGWSWASAVGLAGLVYFLLGGPLVVPQATLGGGPAHAVLGGPAGRLAGHRLDGVPTLPGRPPTAAAASSPCRSPSGCWPAASDTAWPGAPGTPGCRWWYRWGCWDW